MISLGTEDGHPPDPFRRDRRDAPCTAAKTSAPPCSPDLLHEKESFWFVPLVLASAALTSHVPGLSCTCHTGCMNRQPYKHQIYFWKEWGLGHAIRGKTIRSARICWLYSPRTSAPFFIALRIQTRDVRNELVVATSGNTAVGKCSCHQPSN